MKTARDIAAARAEALEIIPAITDEMGRNWNQPDRHRILVDNTHAVMSRPTFDALAEYSATNPTGVYVGKMWKRVVFNRSVSDKVLTWLLCWYGQSDKPGYVSNNYREILIVEDSVDFSQEPKA